MTDPTPYHGSYVVFANADAGVCVTYLWQGQGIKSLYWLAVVVLNVCVLKLQ